MVGTNWNLYFRAIEVCLGTPVYARRLEYCTTVKLGDKELFGHPEIVL